MWNTRVYRDTRVLYVFNSSYGKFGPVMHFPAYAVISGYEG